MKNFGSILAFFAISATVVSARALPADGSVQARSPYPYTDAAEVYSREPKKGRKGKNAGGATANATTAADPSLTSGVAKKAGGRGKGKNAGAAGNATLAADPALTTGAAGKKGKAKYVTRCTPKRKN